MNIFLNFRLKFNIFLRKQLLCISLRLFAPTNNFVVTLSQNLDKYILMYQKEIFYTYKNKHNNYCEDFNKIAA